MIVIVLMSIKNNIFENYLYTLNARLYRQKSGYPIDDNITSIDTNR